MTPREGNLVAPTRHPLDWRNAEFYDEAALEREMERWQLHMVIANLRPEHREVIALVHFEGLKLREAAEQLRIPVGTVKSRCYYALESLRIALEEQGLAP